MPVAVTRQNRGKLLHLSWLSPINPPAIQVESKVICGRFWQQSFLAKIWLGGQHINLWFPINLLLLILMDFLAIAWVHVFQLRWLYLQNDRKKCIKSVFLKGHSSIYTLKTCHFWTNDLKLAELPVFKSGKNILISIIHKRNSCFIVAEFLQLTFSKIALNKIIPCGEESLFFDHIGTASRLVTVC